MRKVYLLGRSGIHANEKFLLEDELIIGRDSKMCQLIYPASEKNISGIHCKIQKIDGKICLIDMNSTNGTFIQDGTRLKPNMPRTMTDGQGFYLGSRENAFDLLIEETAQPAPQYKSGHNVDIPGIVLCALAALFLLMGILAGRGLFFTALRIGGIVLGAIGILRIRRSKIGDTMNPSNDKFSLVIIIAAVVFIIIAVVFGVIEAFLSPVLDILDIVGGILDFF